MAKSKESVDQLLHDLEPVVENQLNRHISQAEPWYPHQYVPYSEGTNYVRLNRRGEVELEGRDWDPSQSKLSGISQVAWYLNLLTEDNLPSYHREIAEKFGRDGAWGQWVHRWTAEENRHATVMRDFIHVTRAVNPIVLDDTRMIQMGKGYATADKRTGDEKIPPEVIAYVSFQELATRVSHRNTAEISKIEGNEHGYDILSRIATDENLHMVFYRNLGKAGLEAAPNIMMRSIANEVGKFQMPGESIPRFKELAVEMAVSGIYNHRLHRDDVLKPILHTHWKIDNVSGLSGDGNRAQQEIGEALEALDKKVSDFESIQPILAESQPERLDKLVKEIFG